MNPDDITKMMLQHRAAEGRRRTEALNPGLPAHSDAPSPASERGERLAWVPTDQGVRPRLDQTWLVPGDVVELFTDRHNGWVRGSVRGTGAADDPLCFVIGAWDPAGPANADGHAPFAGELVMVLPAEAVLRWPV